MSVPQSDTAYEAGQGEPQGASVRVPLGTNRPIAAWVLLVVNVALWVAPAILAGVGVQLFGFPIDRVVLALGWKDNAEILQGAYYRLLTATFLHSNLAHIGLNAFAIYSLGIHAEQVYGTRRFLALYFLAGLGGSVASYMFNPSPAVGASGAIFGLVGGLGVFYYTARNVFGGVARQMVGNMLFIALVNLGFGLTTSFIDNWGHMGGLVAGAIAGFALAPRYRVEMGALFHVVRRESLAYAWPAALALLAALAALVITARPPL